MMKPAPFTYHAPEALEEALSLLAALGPDAAVLAGGQSLLPLLTMRLATPAHVIDIGGIQPLDEVTVTPTAVRIGALASQARVEHDAAVQNGLPLLPQVLRSVGHPAIRSRGTVVGSLVHADPAAELPALLVLLGGWVEVVSAAGRRTIAAADFFAGPFQPGLGAGELVLAATFPPPPARTGTAFVEVARRHGDFPLCAVAASVAVGPDGDVVSARTAYAGVGTAPQLIDVGEAVVGSDPASLDGGAAGGLVRDRIDAVADIHASADYRRHLASVLAARAVGVAASRVGEEDG